MRRFSDWMLRSPGESGASGTGDDGTGKTETPPGSDDGKKPDDEQKGGDQPKPEAEKQFSKADVEAIVKDRLDRERKRSEDAAAKVKAEAEADALAKNKEFEKLAETRGGQVMALETEKATLTQSVETLTGERDRYKGALDGFLKKELDGLPEHILEAIADRDPVAQLEYLTKHREHLKPDGKNGAHVPDTRKPADEKALTEAEKKEREALAARQARARF